MNQNIWQTLKKPIFIQAPMEQVTDTVFRRIIARCGKPDLFYTEFTNTDGLCSRGVDAVGRRLEFTNQETPLIAQIWGTNPKHYYESVKMISKLGFAGIDINMGCPDKAITARGSCSALINNPQLAQEIIQATKEGAGDLPVSVKTRIGFSNIVTDEWIPFLLKQDIAALTLHGRTAKEMSKVPAHWDEIAKAAQLRDKIAPETVFIGNGDVESYDDGLQKIKEYEVDGVMIGRGIFHDLWIFNPTKTVHNIPLSEKLELLIDHITLFNSYWGKQKPFDLMKKFYKVYVSGLPNASDFRMQLMEQKTPNEAILFISSIIKDLSSPEPHPSLS